MTFEVKKSTLTPQLSAFLPVSQTSFPRNSSQVDIRNSLAGAQAGDLGLRAGKREGLRAKYRESLPNLRPQQLKNPALSHHQLLEHSRSEQQLNSELLHKAKQLMRQNVSLAAKIKKKPTAASRQVDAYVTVQQQRKGKALRGHYALQRKSYVAALAASLPTKQLPYMPRYSFTKLKRFHELKDGAEKAAVTKLPALKWTAKDGNMKLERVPSHQLDDPDEASFTLFDAEAPSQGGSTCRLHPSQGPSRLASRLPSCRPDTVSPELTPKASPRLETLVSNLRAGGRSEEAVGQQAYRQFYEKFRNIERVRENSPEGDSASSAYLLRLEELRLLPKPMGLVKKAGNAGELDASHFKMGNDYASALAGAFKYLNPQKVNLHNNRISRKAAPAVFAALAATDCEQVDLSVNEIGLSGTYKLGALLEAPECKILHLNLETNRLGDRPVLQLATSLRRNHSLAKLNLGHNLISDVGATAIAGMLCANDCLEILYLHWNKIRGKGGASLATAFKQHKTLRVVDLGQNSIGSSHSTASALAISDALAAQGLLHLDLSHNQINASDTAIIAQGLRENHSLLGFHYFGNQGYIDPKGFLHPKGPTTCTLPRSEVTSSLPNLKVVPLPQERSASPKQISARRPTDTAKSKLRKGDRVLSRQEKRARKEELRREREEQEAKKAQEIRKDNEQREREDRELLQSRAQANLQEQRQLQADQLFHNLETRMERGRGPYEPSENCWICEGWREVRFRWRRDESGPFSEGPIYLHLDFQDYQPDLMTQLDANTWELFRMVPPGTVRYVYSIQKRSFAAKDQARERSKLKITAKYRYERHPDNPLTNRSLPTARRSSPAPWSPGALTRGPSVGLSLPDEDEKYEIEEVELRFTFVNFIEVTRGTVVDASHHSLLQKCEARPPLRLVQQTHVAAKRAVWRFEDSLFAGYQADNEALMARCFEFDWAHIKVPKLKEEAEVKQLLRKHYRLIKNTFKYWATHVQPGSVLSLSFNTYNEFFIKYLGLIDNKHIRFSDGDTLFLTVNGKRQTPMNPATALVRHQFMEILLRLALKRFYEPKIAQSEPEAVNMAFDEYFVQRCSDYDVHGWRQERYWNEEADNFLKAHLPLLMDLYDGYRGQNRKPGEDRFMKSDEFERIWLDAKLVSDSFGQRDVVLHFTNAVQTQVDELGQDRHLKAKFVEFLEAFARCADRISFAEGGESARVSSARGGGFGGPLVGKMEAVLGVLFHCCSRGVKLKYVWPQREAETGLFRVGAAAAALVEQQLGARMQRRTPRQ